MFSYRFIGASVGNCAGIVGCEQAPDCVKSKLQLAKLWQKTVYFEGGERRLSALNALNTFSTELAHATKDVIEQGDKFITIGGDHSCAVGTWSGVHAAAGEFGLIWIDAHMDAHTTESSHSGNLHGMPVAALMGYGDDKMTKILSDNPKLKPENVVLIGIRSFEEPEQAILKSLGVKVFMMEDVHGLGFNYCFNSAINHFKSKEIPFGISFDLDGLDPQYIEALGTPVEDGILLPEVLSSFKEMPKEQLLGVEITEYNPTLDHDDKGGDVIANIIAAITEDNSFLSEDNGEFASLSRLSHLKYVDFC
ncbi:arginase [Cysteiniphilum litorale]|uniref:Arginase n=2 Tax=Cysteiniphilum TaxID=2056696 RepID=A0A8J2Z6T7_9GAMM|nr:arginase [Cysteiniphilum litorale]GGG07499.1 arginase [Cysteiniphilum litorale]